MSTDRSKRRPGGPAVIVEIGNDWLKVIQVDRNSGALGLARVHVEKIDAIKGVAPDHLTKILRPFLTAGAAVFGCLPRQLATVRTLELPSTNPTEIADMVDLQAGKLTPYSKEEIVVDYKIAGPGRDGYTKIVLVIVQRSVLRNRFSLMEEAGAPLSTMLVGTEGLLNWVRKVYPAGSHQGAVAVLDVDAGFSDLAVTAGDRLLFTRSIQIGATSLQGDDATVRERLAREVLNALQGYGGENPGVRAERLLVTGAGANVAGLVSLLAGRVDIPVEAADCVQIFRKLPAQFSIQDSPYNLVSLTPLCGMAVDINRMDFRLVPESVRLRHDLIQKARALTLLGCLVMTAVMLFSLWGALQYTFRKVRLNDIRSQITADADRVRELERKMRLVELVHARADHRYALYALLLAVHAHLPAPEAILLDSIEFDAERGTMMVSGSGANPEAIRTLLQGLEQSPELVDVREDGTTQQEAGGRWRFRVSCRTGGSHAG